MTQWPTHLVLLEVKPRGVKFMNLMSLFNDIKHKHQGNLSPRSWAWHLRCQVLKSGFIQRLYILQQKMANDIQQKFLIPSRSTRWVGPITLQFSWITQTFNKKWKKIVFFFLEGKNELEKRQILYYVAAAGPHFASLFVSSSWKRSAIKFPQKNFFLCRSSESARYYCYF